MTGKSQNFSGCLYEKNGIWQMRVDYYEHGQRKRADKSTRLPVKGNKKRAQDILDDFISEYEKKSSVKSYDVMFIDFLLEWLENYKSSIELNTYESYKDIITRYLGKQPEAAIPLNEVTPLHIQSLYNRHIRNGLSPNSVLKLHANIRKALQYAYTVDMIPNNPAVKVLLPKKKRFTASFYDENQIAKLLQLVKEEPMYPAILLAAFYGLRRSEILGLKWKSVDFKSNRFVIKDTVVEYDTLEDKEQTKTKSSHRTLPLTPFIADYLSKLKGKQEKDKELLGNGYTVNDYVCKRADGTPFRPNLYHGTVYSNH